MVYYSNIILFNHIILQYVMLCYAMLCYATYVCIISIINNININDNNNYIIIIIIFIIIFIFIIGPRASPASRPPRRTRGPSGERETLKTNVWEFTKGDLVKGGLAIRHVFNLHIESGT